MNALKKYLSSYAEPESQCFDDFPAGFAQGLVIPMYRENLTALERFSQFASNNTGTLLVLVLNRPDSDPSNEWAKKLFLNSSPLSQKPIWTSQHQPINLYELSNQSALLVVDRCIEGQPIPIKQGVGLARKIGADILCQLIADKKVLSPWISNTDADAFLPRNYFQNNHREQKTDKKVAAIIYPFCHIATDNTPLLPTLLYEFSLHYYVAGLQWAQSPYAYHTIGSVIAVEYQHYAMVRGFPKRAAAEDFYLLNKLAKTAAIKSLNNPTVEIAARESNRVPFGTGPAVSQLAQRENLLEMPLYHPDSFLYLRFLIDLFGLLSQQKSTINDCALKLFNNKPSTINIELLLSITQSINLEAALQHSFSHGNSPDARLQHLHHWFDGFKTLKFIHLLRDQHLGTIQYQQWLNNQYAFKTTPQLSLLAEQINSQKSLAP